MSRGRFRGQGGSIPTTMIILSVIMVLAFSMAVLAFHHWGFGQHAHSRQAVRNLAESLAAKAVARLTDERDYGVKAQVSDSMHLFDPDHPGVEAFLTFAPSRSAALKVPCSLNNQEDSSTPGPVGDRVPPRTSQIFVKAVGPDVSYLMEVMMHVPPYPYAVVASGPLETTGAFEVSGVGKAGDFTGSIASLPPDKRRMATVASNNDSASAVSFASGADINGDVQTVGRVSMEPGCRVRGAVKQNWDPAPLPDLSVQEYIDACSTETQLRFCQAVLTPSVSELTVEWVVKRAGDLEVQGDLNLEGGVLYVAGNLHVRGAVKGKGAIVVGGATRIDGAANLAADAVVALMSRGDIVLSGQGKDSSYLQGYVYSEGNVVASRVTILGCLMTRAPADSGAIRLQDASVVAAPIATGTRGGLVCDPKTDDDEVVFSAFAYPNPRGPGLRYRIVAKIYTDERGPSNMLTTAGTADNLTRQQAEDFVLQLDASITPGLKGSNGGSITSREGKSGSLTRMRKYFADLEKPPPTGGVFLNFDINRLLQRSVQPRVLVWRPRPE